MTDTNTAQLVVDLRATDDAVRANGWVAPGLGMPGAPLGLLGSTLNPLSGLAAAGLGWFMPLVSFLGDGLTQLQGGNGASVTSGSQDFGAAGRDIGGVASAYRESTRAETTGWSGPAASDYRNTATQYADGVAGLGQGSTTVGSAIIGAGQVVAQAIAEVTELIAEAVAQIVPIMTQAIARAPETFGQSVVEAIPPCVGIAVEYALRIAAKLAALVASGDNLMKLVQGGLAVVDLIKQALSSISQQSTRPEAEPQLSAGADQPSGGGPASGKEAADFVNPEASAASSLSSSGAGGFGGSSPAPGMSTPGMSTPTGSAVPPGVAAQSIGAIPPLPGTVPDASRYPGHVATGVPAGTAPGGPPPVGAAALGLGAGTRTAGHGADTARPDRKTPEPSNPAPDGPPMGGMPGARAGGEKDKEHERKYTVVEDHQEVFQFMPAVISPKKPKN